MVGGNSSKKKQAMLLTRKINGQLPDAGGFGQYGNLNDRARNGGNSVENTFDDGAEDTLENKKLSISQ